MAGGASAAGHEPASAGFYGGIAVRDGTSDGPALTVGIPSSALSRFAPAADEGANRTLFYGGYRFRNEVAIEATFNATDKYALRPTDGPLARRGIGLAPGSVGFANTEPGARAWNVDVYTSWNFLKSFSLYGRLGYAQSDVAPVAAVGAMSPGDARRLRDGMNYGLGLRYDMSSALGLRLEYGRFGRFAGETAATAPEADQVTFGVQFRF